MAQKKLSSNEPSISKDAAEEQTSTLSSTVDVVVAPEKDGIVSSIEDDRTVTASDKSTTHVNKRKPDGDDNNVPVLDIPSTDAVVVEAGKQIPDDMEAAIADVEVIAPTSNTELNNVNVLDVHEEQLLSTPNQEAVEINKENRDDAQSNKLGSEETISKTDRDMSESATMGFQDNDENQTKNDSNKAQPPVDQKQQENTADKSPTKVQDQLEEV